MMNPLEVEVLLADFREWLTNPNSIQIATPETPQVDFAELLRQFTALRHEVNLQTKASRTANEQFAEAMKLFANPPQPADPDEAVRPILKTLLEVADALRTAHRQLDRTQEFLEPLIDELEELQTSEWPEPPTPIESKPPGFLARVFGGVAPSNDVAWQKWASDVVSMHTQQELTLGKLQTRWAELLKGISDGYAMSLRRVERALPSLGLELIACEDEPFNPETMEAVELVDGDEPGTVVEVVRPGYRFKGKLFRFAQVKVAR